MPLRGRFSIRPPQRQRFPRFSAGAAVRSPASPSSRCSKAVLRSGRIPQRQRFPRFSAGAVVRFPASPSSRCSKAALQSGRIPQRQHFTRFSAGAIQCRCGRRTVRRRSRPDTCVSCADILQCPAYHRNSFRLLSKTYVLTTCWTRHISLPNGHSAPCLHKSSRCPFSECLIIRYFCKRALLDT